MERPKSGISGLRTVGAFLNNRACSDTLFHVLNNCAFKHPLTTEERAAMPLAGGIMQHGYQCGMIWGATLAAGAQAYRLHGPGPRAEAAAISAAQRLVGAFRRLNEHVNCSDITGIDESSTAMNLATYFFLKGGTIGCFRMAARYAPVALGEINAALAGDDLEVPSPPVSCAAMVAQRMGASEMHAVMAAGLAGGIGLSGGACGALGAALWIRGMNKLDEDGKLAYKSREAEEVIARFVKSTGCEFECAKVAGRRFDSIGDHAAYVRDGGCAEVIEALAGG